MSEKPKRRWFQFSLRTLLAFVLLVSIGMSWLGVNLCRARRQRELVEAIVKSGGGVVYEHDSPGAEPRVPAWLRELLGDDFFFDVSLVFLDDGDLITRLTDLPDLRELLLDYTQVTDAGLVHVTGLTNLTMLGLSHTQVTDAGLEHIKRLGKLEELFLSHTQVTDAGLVHIKGITNLRVLLLDDTEVTDAGLEHLKGLTNLERLNLEGTKVTVGGAKDLKEKLPKLQIYGKRPSLWSLFFGMGLNTGR